MQAAWSSCVFLYWQVENLLLSAGGMVKLCVFVLTGGESVVKCWRHGQVVCLCIGRWRICC